MDYLALTGIAIGLAADAFAVSVTNGAVLQRVTVLTACKIAAAFGIFQGIMPFCGWLLGKAGQTLLQAVDHWVALLLLCYLGSKMLWENRKSTAQEQNSSCTLTLKTLLALAIATSIDALATGIILPSAVGAVQGLQMLFAVSFIAAVTFVLCCAGVLLGKVCGCFLQRKASIAGGMVLISIGVKIFITQMFC